VWPDGAVSSGTTAARAGRAASSSTGGRRSNGSAWAPTRNSPPIRLRKRLLFLANALKQHPVGLEEVDDGIWSIHFCHVLLGRVDERDHIIQT